MIKSQCFQKEWIDELRKQKEYQKINPPLLEKMIHALSLLQHLRTQQLDFIFKGGTSLILLLDNANRFSVDIDIITEASREHIEHILEQVDERSVFTHWRLDERRSYRHGIPKAHYELEYPSRINKGANYILLDILFEKAHYPSVQELPIQSKWILTETLIPVSVPTIESITGDKLTAFAPTTTGILYGKGKELEIIKQLFDLGHLFDQIQTVEIAAASFSTFARQEAAYRNLTITPQDILQDSINTCRIISFRERNKANPERSWFAELQNGIRSFSSYLIQGHFQIEEAIVSSAKVAYLSARILKEDHRPLEKYVGQQLQEMDITNQDWNGLNKLRRFRDQSAFFYRYHCLNTLGLN